MAAMQPVGGPRWRKSSLSGSSACVEIGLNDGDDVYMRDSKAPDGPVLRFTSEEWRAFLEGVRRQEFNR